MKTLHPAAAYTLRNSIEACTSGLIQTALVIYLVRTLAVSPAQMALLGVAHMATHVLLEIPTGIVADVFSRKASILIGGILIGVNALVVGSAPLYALALIATIIEAAGDTFVSGALDAWLTDEVGADQAARVILRAEQLGTPVYWAGVGASVLLSTVFAPRAPIVLGGALWLVACVALWRLMPETGFVRRAGATASWRSTALQFVSTLRDGLRLVLGSRLLLLLFATQALIGAFDGGFYNLDKLHLFTHRSLPELRLPAMGVVDESAWVALLQVATSLLYVLGLWLLRLRADITDAVTAPKVLLTLFAGVGVSAVAFVLAPAFGAALALLAVMSTLRMLVDPLLRTWFNRHVTSDVRATVLSMGTQANRFGMMTGGLLAGALGEAVGLRAALLVATLALLPLMHALRLAMRQQRL